MKRKITKILAALALLVFTMPSLVAWGQTTASVTFSELGYSNAQSLDGVTISLDDNISCTFNQGSGSNPPAYYNTATAARLYGGNTLTVTPASDCTITGMTFTFSGTSNTGTLSPSVGTYSLSSSTGTWTGSSASAVVITNTASTGHARIKVLSVTYTTGGSSVTSTTVTIDDSNLTNTNLYNGTVAGSLSATVSANGEPIEGATVTWASSNTGVATIASDGTVTLVAVGSTNITASYAGVEGEYGASSATYPLNVTNSDPNAPGTANNPYSVAQALAANPATGVYVHGIISTITEVSTQHGNATYNISDDGTTSGEMIVYRGKYLDNTAFTSGDQIQVGDEVVVTGELKLYSGANQLTTGNYIVSLVRPTPTVAAPVFTPAAGTYLGTQNVTITCETEGSSIYYTTNGSTPTNESTLYNGAITVSETTTIKAIAYVGTDASAVATATYTIEQPLTTIQAILDVATSTATAHYITFGNWVVTGKNSNGHQAFATDGVNGFVLYNSDDMGFVAGDVLSGTLQCNVQLFGESAEITGLTSTTEGLTVTPNGTVTAVETTIDQLAPINTGSVITLNNVTYNGSALSDGTNIIYPYNTMYEGTYENGTSYNVTGVFFYNGGNKRIMPRSEEDIEELQPVQVEAIYDYSINGVEGEAFDSYVGATITLTAGEDIHEDYTFAGWTIDPNNIVLLNGSYTLTEEVTTFYAVYAHTTGSTGGDPTYEKVNNLSDIVSGEYIIVSDGYYLQNEEVTAKNGFPCDGKTVTIVDNTVTNVSSDMLWAFSGTNEAMSITAGEFCLYTVSDNNGLRNTTISNPGTWSFAVNENGFSMKYSETNRYCGIYVAGGVNTNWRSYNSATASNYADGGQLYLYKKTGGGTPGTTNYYTIVKFKEVAAYEGDGGYVLVASPVSTTPDAAGMITDDLGAQATTETSTYDLYSFDQAQEQEWINYRQGGFNTIEPGKGYLYASKNGTTLTFAGVPSSTNSATLSLSGNGDFAGWNLVGNPFSVPAYIGTRAYYRIGNGGADIVAATAGTAIDVMEGIFVIAAQNGEQLTFSTTAAKGASVAMNVVRNRGNVIDRAIVRFDEGDQLPKFQLFENSTKLYIPQGNQDYAVVRSAAEAEMPLSFKASENGTYTLAVETENMEMDYLHLIDNMTGMDVDLLQTPNYTFEASTREHANRFRLVFKGNSANEQTAETFAFFNGSSWTVSNLGEATLQVVDVTGRTVSSETINGNATINLNQTPGVYMLRLVNGNSVKTQKVVVR